MLHSVLAQFKKKLNPDRKAKEIFIIFLGKLIEKGKGFIIVNNPKEVDYSDKTFKIYNDIISILTDNLKEESFISSI